MADTISRSTKAEGPARWHSILVMILSFYPIGIVYDGYKQNGFHLSAVRIIFLLLGIVGFLLSLWTFLTFKKEKLNV